MHKKSPAGLKVATLQLHDQCLKLIIPPLMCLYIEYLQQCCGFNESNQGSLG